MMENKLLADSPLKSYTNKSTTIGSPPYTAFGSKVRLIGSNYRNSSETKFISFQCVAK